ncbi:acetate--CoA ligase family protein [Picrophilus oshimae]|uniref:acetate--CoA ligase (ADP-forming) n=1 Tax=Picrophilus torridus (strain ATCC 700027 / DSM 9790 / JCM 10055 / NBRC 100828 / KAW 2/3) TaxID=1122961 RepID=A0A8G2FW44_PICTO|nr:acetate--CoA ligase [Picrophilus oshimae]SMD30571.1 acetyl coenzyme A synthetase (ADP forming), alpha domain-containing protein [Picrophilus oshimae DSM 9789]
MLDKLFKPKSIAVVGASTNKEKIGNIILRNIISTFSGKIYPVNNKSDNVEGYKSYKSLKDINETVDLAIVAVPRDSVPDVIQDAIDSGTGAAIIITSGFKETDQHGAELEEKIKSMASGSGLRFLGPNTIGIITPSFNGTFAFSDNIKGGAALVAQSGGLGVYMLNWAQKTRTGISYFVSLGNQTDIKESDIFEFLANDVETKAIFSYLEGVSDGDAFLNTVPEVTKKKPLIFLKGGTGKSGTAAIKTHTGSVAGSVDIFKAAVRACGGIFVESLEDMLNIAKLVSSSESVSRDILVITNSGGHGVLTSDAIESYNLNEIEIPDRIKENLKKVLPDQSVPRNPLDLSGDADSERYKGAIELTKDLDCTKLVIVQSLPMVSCTDVARAMIRYRGKSLVGVTMGLDEDAASRILESAYIPAFKFPEDAVKAIKYMTDRMEPVRKIRIPQPVSEAWKIVSGKSYIRDFEALKIMELYGIKTPRYGIAMDAETAQKVADDIGYPVVMKISGDEPLHKTEMNGVYLNVERDMVKDVFNRLNYKRVLIEEQLNGAEIFIGGIKDPVFGHTVVAGIGGIYVEVLKRLAYALSPVSEEEAEYLLNESNISKIITARKRNYDKNSIIRAISNVSRMIVDLNISQLDINPLIVNETGAYAVDVRMII